MVLVAIQNGTDGGRGCQVEGCFRLVTRLRINPLNS